MNVIVTCGPAFAPIDQVRRLTNFSTGRLGALLADHFAAQGWKTLCLRGETASAPPPQRAPVIPFSTNENLAERLATLAQGEPVDAVFHAAALCDFQVGSIEGVALAEPKKIPSRRDALRLTLTPAPKVLPRLRDWFPAAQLVGWKYELEGTRNDAFGRAWLQLTEARTDACVLNGAAYGDGFALCLPGGEIRACANPEALAEMLALWLSEKCSD